MFACVRVYTFPVLTEDVRTVHLLKSSVETSFRILTTTFAKINFSLGFPPKCLFVKNNVTNFSQMF
jgi:hypothetical protein